MHPNYTEADFDLSPLMFYYEVTQACDLVCKHCRASAQEQADPQELGTEQSKALIDQGKDADLRIFPPGNHGVAWDFVSYLQLQSVYLDYLEEHLIYL